MSINATILSAAIRTLKFALGHCMAPESESSPALSFLAHCASPQAAWWTAHIARVFCR